VDDGHTRVKIKVGLPDLEEDLERVAAVRKIIGPQRLLMVDANQLWDYPSARRAAHALAAYEPFWLEEPLPADDLQAYVRLRATIDIPIATGESLYTELQFRDLLAAGGCDFAQPNICRVGGITPFLRIARLAHAHGIPTMPHLLPELSAQLGMCLPAAPLLEDIDRASYKALNALEKPSGVELSGDTVRVDTGPGHGLDFALDEMEEVST
jgi:L-alanine-DL-glutamate epimerase-like enolase superfamily enzyme